MLSDIISNIIANLLGQGIETAGDQARLKWGRFVFYAFAVGLTVYLLIASLFLWQSPAYPGVVGLIQFIPKAGAAWMLAVPGLAALTMVLLLLPIAGRLIFTLLSAIATTAVGFAVLITFQGHSSGISDLPTNISLFGMLVIVLVTLALALNDRPALMSPLARWAIPYSMRLNHLRALQQSGRDHGWEIVGPTGTQNTLMLSAPYGREHQMYITSAMRLRLSQDNATDGAILSVAIRSQYDIPGFYSGPKRLEPNNQQGLELEVPISGKSPVFAYIEPYPQLPLTPAVAEQIMALIRARQGVLPADAIVQATPLGMRVRYTRFYRRLTAKDGRPDAILQWLDQLVTTLEQISPGLSAEELAQRWQVYRPKL